MRAFADVADSVRELEAQRTYDAAHRPGHDLVSIRDEMCVRVFQVLRLVPLVPSVLDDVPSFTHLFGSRVRR